MSIICILVVFITDFSIGGYKPKNSPHSDYSSDESGNVYMYINVIGHVKTPGTYMLYEGVDVLTLLSAAGGPLPGAQLTKILLYRDGDNMISLNLDLYLDTGKGLDISFRPNDTIYIKQTLGSYLLSKSTILNTILTMFNIYFTIDQNN